jgi:hypothetical protein
VRISKWSSPISLFPSWKRRSTCQRLKATWSKVPSGVSSGALERRIFVSPSRASRTRSSHCSSPGTPSSQGRNRMARTLFTIHPFSVVFTRKVSQPRPPCVHRATGRAGAPGGSFAEKPAWVLGISTM